MTTRQSGPDLGTREQVDGTRALRAYLTLDALASGLLGVLLAVLGAAVLDDLLGLPAALLVPAGIFLVVFAGWLRYLATRPVVSTGAADVVIVVNALWVIASVVLVVAGWFSLTALGVAFVLVQAATVALFAAMQVGGLRRAARALR